MSREAIVELCAEGCPRCDAIRAAKPPGHMMFVDPNATDETGHPVINYRKPTAEELEAMISMVEATGRYVVQR